VLIAWGWGGDRHAFRDVGRADGGEGGRIAGLRTGGDAVSLAGGGLGEQVDGEAGVAGGVAALGTGQDSGGFAGGVRGEGQSGFGGQGAEDGGELGGGVAGEVDDGGEAGGERGCGVQHVAERAGLAGQDDGEFVAVVLPGFGQVLVQAAEQVLAAAGQVVPGVRR
jgi:hypothetical protein